MAAVGTKEPATESTTDVDNTSAVDARFSCNICFDDVSDPVVTQCGHLYCWSCLYRWLEPGMLPHERDSLFGRRTFGAMDESRRVCPVCKSPCSVETVIPIYVRNADEKTIDLKQQQQQQQQQPSPENATIDEEEEEEGSDNPLPENESTTGLRQRRVACHDDANSVPARPTSTISSSNSAAVATTTASTANHSHHGEDASIVMHDTRPSSLFHGMALELMRASSGYYTETVPPLHNRGQQFQQTTQDSDPDSTEFLSRLLLMLASFVLLCLLLF